MWLVMSLPLQFQTAVVSILKCWVVGSINGRGLPQNCAQLDGGISAFGPMRAGEEREPLMSVASYDPSYDGGPGWLAVLYIRSFDI